MKWDMLVAHRRYCLKMGIGMFFLAFVTIGLEVAGYDVKVQASALFVIFGMWMFSLLGVLQQLADMQARLDMKRIARGEMPE